MSGREPALRGGGPERNPGASGLALAGTALIHGAAVGMLFVNPSSVSDYSPPVYTVRLVAAPRPQPQARRAPEVIERPAQRAEPLAQRPSVAEMLKMARGEKQPDAAKSDAAAAESPAKSASAATIGAKR